ncbi:hypothetical protein [Herminiimonas arsenitoxidans]|uniref:hypothetical protein n=1 Tax=Herminiimonas arsenitoxidans TaxID=1809410 RepID=UPI0009708AA4|nr:hypothetical protein [Herminiimonas arsenitoxidans]
MQTTTETILHLAKIRPGITADEIESETGIDVDRIQSHLNDLANKGQLLAAKVPASGGGKKMVYSLNPTYLGWREPGSTQKDQVEIPRFAGPKSPVAGDIVKLDDDVMSSLSVGGFQITEWKAGNISLSANNRTVELAADQSRALRAFIALT